MSFINSVLPFALLGILFGIIFVSDGWISYQGSDQSFAKSPKVRGLLYILGGGIISLVRELTQNTNIEKVNTISVYTLFVTLSILLALSVLSLYAFLVSFKRLRRISRGDSWIDTAIETLPFIAVAIQEGNKRFTQEIDQRLAPKYILQRNQVMEFIGTAYNNLCEYQFTNRKNIQEFEEFIRKYLEEFIDVFLDDSKVNYRACLYWLDKNQDKLLFFTGYSTLTAQYTKESLPKEGSLAGYALENSFVVHFYPISPTMSSLPFFHKTRDKRYKSVAVCTVKHPTINNNFFPKMTLCVDCIHEQAKAFGDIDYISKVIVLLSIIFANALTLMDINDEAIRKYIESR